ncbi:hypothetical protein GQ55_1G000500 [Panicum hallii var. hallii]|uniref:Uncharacterized protein n=1 Tax=Panicum hallii var. hallii TaxID=1504633 RepID=A0A2T7F0J7_9POAL|nr:hypothetical protein GQ55_1G000500 [Panicum hallii var. hallii]
MLSKKFTSRKKQQWGLPGMQAGDQRHSGPLDCPLVISGNATGSRDSNSS